LFATDFCFALFGLLTVTAFVAILTFKRIPSKAIPINGAIRHKKLTGICTDNDGAPVPSLDFKNKFFITVEVNAKETLHCRP